MVSRGCREATQRTIPADNVQRAARQPDSRAVVGVAVGHETVLQQELVRRPSTIVEEHLRTRHRRTLAAAHLEHIVKAQREGREWGFR
eukprot:1387595-Prymnesium_polylepis.1